MIVGSSFLVPWRSLVVVRARRVVVCRVELLVYSRVRETVQTVCISMWIRNSVR